MTFLEDEFRQSIRVSTVKSPYWSPTLETWKQIECVHIYMIIKYYIYIINVSGAQVHSKICHQQNTWCHSKRRILEILKFGAMTCETESDFVVCIELNNNLAVTGHVLAQFSALYYFYRTDLHFSHFQASFQVTRIICGRRVCFDVVHLKFAFWWIVNKSGPP